MGLRRRGRNRKHAMGKIWQKITYYRHRSELFALRLALRVPLLAPLLIGAMLHFWWCVAPLPILIPVVLVSENLGPLGPMVAGMSALAMLFFALPWFSGWCSRRDVRSHCRRSSQRGSFGRGYSSVFRLKHTSGEREIKKARQGSVINVCRPPAAVSTSQKAVESPAASSGHS